MSLLPKRRQSYVDANVQGRLIRRLMLHWIAFFVVTILGVTLLKVLTGDPDTQITTRLAESFNEQILIGLVIVSILPAFMLDTVRFSNRFVGPVARLRQSMRQLGKGENPGSLRFRDEDFWIDAAEEFNTVARRMMALEAEVRRLRNHLEKSNKREHAHSDAPSGTSPILNVVGFPSSDSDVSPPAALAD